jgi:archaeal flagellin FlaB
MSTIKKLPGRILGGQKGITGLETAIILIAFIVVATVFAYSTLSAGLFTTDRARDAVYSGMQEVQGTLEVRGNLTGYKDSLNAGGSGSIGKLQLTLTAFSGGQIDFNPAYTIDSGTGALTHSNPGNNALQVAYTDDSINIPDCAWTASWIGNNNNDNMLDPNEKAVLIIWLHTFDGTVWGPAGGETSPFLGTHYLDTYHTFTINIRAGKGSTLSIQRTTPSYLFNIIDLH